MQVFSTGIHNSDILVFCTGIHNGDMLVFCTGIHNGDMLVFCTGIHNGDIRVQVFCTGTCIHNGGLQYSVLVFMHKKLTFSESQKTLPTIP